MIWIGLFILSIVLSIYGYKRVSNYNKNCNPDQCEKDQTFSKICAVVAVITGLISVGCVADGITDYPYLVKKLAMVETLQQRIVDIREANYKYVVNGTLVAGSIENWKQSTNLSTYISSLATLEAEYNGYLEKCKVYKSSFLLQFFGYGWAISDKVFTLKYISN